MKTNGTQYFYLNEKLARVQKNASQRTICWAAGTAVAERRNTAINKTELLATDDKGSISLFGNSNENRLTYTAYGHSKDLSALEILLGFNSEHLETLSQFYLLGTGYHRGFSPTLMRFLSPDNISPFGAGGFNPYAYCANDPINAIDPSGHSPLKWFANTFRNRIVKLRAKIESFQSATDKFNKTLREIVIPNTEQIESARSISDLNTMANQLSLEKQRLPAVQAISKNTTNYAQKHKIKLPTQDTQTLNTINETINIIRVEIDNRKAIAAMKEMKKFDRNKPTGPTIGVSKKQKREKQGWNFVD
ncbi:TPA: RHS repeat-associated core domain-containing protein [Pseudomonas putida]|nr:RHS repeat-associated core domain-containing protein [Pseudomonas putida]